MYDVISLADASLAGMFPAKPYATRVETTNRIPLAGAQRSHMPLSMCSLLRRYGESIVRPPPVQVNGPAYVRFVTRGSCAAAQPLLQEAQRLLGRLAEAVAGVEILVPDELLVALRDQVADRLERLRLARGRRRDGGCGSGVGTGRDPLGDGSEQILQSGEVAGAAGFCGDQIRERRTQLRDRA